MNTKRPSSDTSSYSGVESVPNAAGEVLAANLRTPRTSDYWIPESTWKRKAASLGATDENYSECVHRIRRPTCGYCYPQTIGQQENIKNGTPGGQSGITSSSMSDGQFPTLGLPKDPKERKKVPLWTGLVKYFPAALAAVARVSFAGGEQHNPGKPLFWDRNKSMDQEDTLLRHLWESGTIDTDGQRHSAKVAWRALAMLQLEIERDANR